MKILHIITRLIQGGAQQNTVLSCKAQRLAGHDVTLVYGPIYGPEGSLFDEAKASGAKLIELSPMVRPPHPRKDWACYRTLRRFIHEMKPDVVHTHSSKAGVLGRAAAWKEKVPAVIHTVHGLPFHDRQSRLVHHGYVAAERWAARRCHHLIAITAAMVEAFHDSRIATPDRFTIIPSGVDLRRFRVDRDTMRPDIREAWGVGVDAPVLGIVARLDPLKGHDDLLDILPMLREHVPDLRLVFIGDGWRREHLEQRVATEGFDDIVIFTGLVEHREIAKLLTAVDVKALPSYQEGQSRTLIEALLCGCAIVAYDVGGIGSVCINGQTGRLAPLGDKTALGDAIIELFDHPEERARFAERGKAYVKRNFDAQAMTEMIERVYYEVLNRGK